MVFNFKFNIYNFWREEKRYKIFFFLFIIILLATSVFFARLYIIEENRKSNTDKILNCPKCNLIIISLTNTRKDRLGLYGNQENITPNIDSFFKNSMIFNNAFAPASWTLPDAASFFTSLFPYSHGITSRDSNSVLNNELLTFPEIFQNNGYSTTAFTGDGDYNRKFNLDQGFDFYLDMNNYGDIASKFPEYLIRSGLAFAHLKTFLPNAVDWLNKNSKKPFFLFLQGFDNHCPFNPDEPFRNKFIGNKESSVDYTNCLATFSDTEPIYKDGKKYFPVTNIIKKEGELNDFFVSENDVDYLNSLYDGAINETDFYLDELFQQIEKLGLEENTIIVFMAEHGDLLGEHGWFMRGGANHGAFYDPVINFPIAIKHPKIKEPIIVDDLVQTVDIMPSLLNMLGLKDPKAKIRQGSPLNLSVFGDQETNQYAYSATNFLPTSDIFFSGTSTVESVRNKEWKLIKNFTNNNIQFNQLYNIKNDPEELINLYNFRQDIANNLENNLKSWKEKINYKKIGDIWYNENKL